MNAHTVASFYTLSGAAFGEAPRTSFAERCEAAAAAGFSGIGLRIDDLDRTVASGVTVEDMRAILTHTGLELTEIEFLSGWALQPDAATLRRLEDKLYAVADLLGGRHVTTGEFAAGDQTFDIEQAASRFQALCRRVADHGLLVALEPFPWSVIRDVRTALHLLGLAAAPNAGLLVDAWHFFNCGATLDDLDSVPASRISAVQLNDGPRVQEDFLWHARNRRRLPGDGELDVVGLVRRLQRIGYAGPYCVEVNYPGFRELPVTEAAEQAYRKVVDILQRARPDAMPMG